MAIIATVHLRGSCPKKKGDVDGEQIGFNIEAGKRIPAKMPKYMVTQWLASKAACRVDDGLLKDDGSSVEENFFDDFEGDFPQELGGQEATLVEGELLLPKPNPIDSKRNSAEIKARDEAEAKAVKEAEALAKLEAEEKAKAKQ